MNRKLLLIILGAFVVQLTFAQSKPLIIGEQIPKLKLTHLFNTTAKSIDLDQLKGKIILIDFWTTYCPTCISGLERMDALQKKYKDSIFIIPVSPQKKEVVAKFWRSNHITKKLSLPTLTDDRRLHELFPHSGTPAEFWIGPDGTFLGPTSIEYVNDSEIDKLLQKKSLDWIHKGLITPYDFSKPLISTLAADTSKVFYSSFLSFKPDKRTSSNIVIDSLKRTVRITFINYNISGLYNATLTKGLEKFQKQWIVDVKDSSRLRYYKSFGYRSKWDIKNSYCYELFWPLDKSNDLQEIYDKVRSDFDHYFGLRSSVSYRKCNYLLLTGAPGRPYPKGENSIALNEMLDILNQSSGLPIISDQASGTNTVFIDFSMAAIKDVEILKSSLRDMGYQLSLHEGELPFFTLEDTKGEL